MPLFILLTAVTFLYGCGETKSKKDHPSDGVTETQPSSDFKNQVEVTVHGEQETTFAFEEHDGKLTEGDRENVFCTYAKDLRSKPFNISAMTQFDTPEEIDFDFTLEGYDNEESVTFAESAEVEEPRLSVTHTNTEEVYYRYSSVNLHEIGSDLASSCQLDFTRTGKTIDGKISCDNLMPDLDNEEPHTIPLKISATFRCDILEY